MNFNNNNITLNIKHKLQSTLDGKFNVLYININGLRNKLEDLEIIIASYGNKIVHLVALAEIRLFQGENNKFNLNHYSAYFSNRSDGYGGAALYVHESLSGFEIFNECVNNIHCLIVKILSCNFNVGVSYKQPLVQKREFIEYFRSIIEKNLRTLFIGDFNLNLLHCDGITSDFIEKCASNGYYILNKIDLNYATRISEKSNGSTSGTIIDLVCTDLTDYEYVISLNNHTISDHKMILLSIDDKTIKTNKYYQIKQITTYKSIDSREFNGRIENININNIASLDLFLNALYDMKNSCIKTCKTVKTFNPFKPWVNNELIMLINERERYYRLLKKSRSNIYLQTKYKNLSKVIIELKKKLRNDSNSRSINNNINNPRKLWKNFNQIIYNKEGNTNNIDEISNNNIHLKTDSIITDKRSIGEIFNRFYCSVGKCLYENIIFNKTDTNPDLLQYNQNTFFLNPTSDTEVLHKINCLKSSNSIHDIITAIYIKQNANLFAKFFVQFINESFLSGEFPELLKTTRIVPIFKNGNPLDPSNYRPINILPATSKIFEMIIYDRLNDFCLKYNLINKNQFGFQKKSGTLSATISIINFLQTKMDESKNSVAGCIFIDLKSAFDTVPHSQLLDKLYNYGFRGKSHDLLKSYISKCKQFVDVNGTCSDMLQNNNPFSVTQGSNLGPLLFLIFINDIFNLRLNGKLVMFADDASISYVQGNTELLKLKMQEDIDLLVNWFAINKLTMNVKKTKCMLITMNKTISLEFKINLMVYNDIIEQVNEFKYLGLIIQCNLKWNAHIQEIKKKNNSIVFCSQKNR